MSFFHNFKPLIRGKLNKPLYLQIESVIKNCIMEGQLRASERLPSSRVLANRFAVSRQTILNALNELIAEGFITSDERIAYFVASELPVGLETFPTPRNNHSDFQWRVKDILPADFSEEGQSVDYNFVAGTPNFDLFPFSEFKRHLLRVMNYPIEKDFSYGHAAGHPELISSLDEYLRRSRNISNRPLMITNGSQEAIYMVSRLLLSKHDAVAVNALDYQPAWAAFKLNGATLVKIKQDQDGLIPDDLSRQLEKNKSIKLIYLTPQLQHPTTATLSQQRREKIYQLAMENGIPIVEDDYDHEFHYYRHPLQPMASFDPSQIIIYIGTLSKVLYPGARIGFITSPKPVFDGLVKLRQIISHKNESTVQRATALWMEDGGFERHVRRSTSFNKKKLEFTCRLLQKIQEREVKRSGTLQIEYIKPNGGTALWVKINVNCELLAKKARSQNILIQDESCFSDLPVTRSRHLRLGFARQSEIKQQEGIDKLFTIARTLKRQG